MERVGVLQRKVTKSSIILWLVGVCVGVLIILFSLNVLEAVQENRYNRFLTLIKDSNTTQVIDSAR